MKPFLALLAALAIASGLAAAAQAAVFTPATGPWAGKASEGTDAVSFRIAKSGSRYKAGKIVVRTDAQCEGSDAGGGVSVRRLKISIPATKLAEARTDTSAQFLLSKKVTRKLSGGKRIQSVSLKVTFNQSKAARAVATVTDNVTSDPTTTCKSKVSVKVKAKS